MAIIKNIAEKIFKQLETFSKCILFEYKSEFEKEEKYGIFLEARENPSRYLLRDSMMEVLLIYRNIINGERQERLKRSLEPDSAWITFSGSFSKFTMS